MKSTKITRLTSVLGVLFACIIMQNSAQAMAVSYVFLDNLVQSETLEYKDTTDTYTAKVSAWATTGADIGFGPTIETAIAHEMTNGLGVCNNNEGGYDTCITKNNRPAIGNSGEYEWILVMLPEVSKIDSFTIFPDGDSKRHVTYFTGWLDPLAETDLTGLTVADFSADRSLGGLGLTQYNVDNGKDTTPVTINLATTPAFIGGGTGDVWGNAILIGASIDQGGAQVVLNSISTTIPLPAGVWLFISAIGALAARRKLSS